MTEAVDLRVLELLAARLCHDLIGPMAAIGNGVELLADEDPEFARDAVGLIGASTRKVNRRLQFYRFAYGFVGGGLTGPPPDQLATALFEETPIACDYGEAVRAMPLEWQKLACNLLAIGADALPRGGRLVLGIDEIGPQVQGTGENARPAAAVCAALTLDTPVDELTSRTAAAYFTGLLARRLGCRICIDGLSQGFRFTLLRAAAPAA